MAAMFERILQRGLLGLFFSVILVSISAALAIGSTAILRDEQGQDSRELLVRGSQKSLDPAGKEPPMKIPDTGKVRIYDAGTKTYVTVDKVVRTPQQWRKILTPEQYRIIREHGTERAFCGIPTKDHKNGIYKCVGCGTDVFVADVKFDSGTGWPSFWQPVDEANVGYDQDRSAGMLRTEVHCARCGAHFGHVFDDGPPPTHKRYCINSMALKFIPSAK